MGHQGFVNNKQIPSLAPTAADLKKLFEALNVSEIPEIPVDVIEMQETKLFQQNFFGSVSCARNTLGKKKLKPTWELGLECGNNARSVRVYNVAMYDKNLKAQTVCVLELTFPETSDPYYDGEDLESYVESKIFLSHDNPRFTNERVKETIPEKPENIEMEDMAPTPSLEELNREELNSHRIYWDVLG